MPKHIRYESGWTTEQLWKTGKEKISVYATAGYQNECCEFPHSLQVNSAKVR